MKHNEDITYESFPIFSDSEMQAVDKALLPSEYPIGFPIYNLKLESSVLVELLRIGVQTLGDLLLTRSSTLLYSPMFGQNVLFSIQEFLYATIEEPEVNPLTLKNNVLVSAERKDEVTPQTKCASSVDLFEEVSTSSELVFEKEIAFESPSDESFPPGTSLSKVLFSILYSSKLPIPLKDLTERVRQRCSFFENVESRMVLRALKEDLQCVEKINGGYLLAVAARRLKEKRSESEKLTHDASFCEGLFDFLNSSRNQTSYKLVLGLVFFDDMDELGRVELSRLKELFLKFYLARKEQGLPVEKTGAVINAISTDNLMLLAAIATKEPLNSFLSSRYFFRSGEYLSLEKSVVTWVLGSNQLQLKEQINLAIDKYYEGVAPNATIEGGGLGEGDSYSLSEGSRMKSSNLADQEKKSDTAKQAPTLSFKLKTKKKNKIRI